MSQDLADWYQEFFLRKFLVRCIREHSVSSTHMLASTGLISLSELSLFTPQHFEIFCLNKRHSEGEYHLFKDGEKRAPVTPIAVAQVPACQERAQSPDENVPPPEALSDWHLPTVSWGQSSSVSLGHQGLFPGCNKKFTSGKCLLSASWVLRLAQCRCGGGIPGSLLPSNSLSFIPLYTLIASWPPFCQGKGPKMWIYHGGYVLPLGWGRQMGK